MNKCQFSLLTRWFICFLLAVVLSACTSNSRVIDHSFSFDVRRAVPTIELLDYQYGNSQMIGTRPPDWALNEGYIGQQFSVSGLLLVGDFLYVKWRIKETGEVFEKNIDLRSRLPWNIKGQRVYFEIKGTQLYIYLVAPEYLPKGSPPTELKNYSYHPYQVIYPDQSKH